MKKSLKNSLLKMIQERGRVESQQIFMYCLEWDYKQSNAERRLRELIEAGLIHPVYSKSKRNTLYISAYTAEKQVEKPKAEYKIINRDGQPVAVAV